jgi:hypothetical protein
VERKTPESKRAGIVADVGALRCAESVVFGEERRVLSADPQVLAATIEAAKGCSERNGSPSSLDIEPCASRRALISGAFWRMFASLALRHSRLVWECLDVS